MYNKKKNLFMLLIQIIDYSNEFTGKLYKENDELKIIEYTKN
jgi:hypothetical protein